MNPNDQLQRMSHGLNFIVPELILAGGICLLLIQSMLPFKRYIVLQVICCVALLASLACTLLAWPVSVTPLFENMLSDDDFSSYFRLIADTGALLTVLMTRQKDMQKPAEYLLLIVAAALGCHILVMANNFITVVLGLELVSLSSYALVGWTFSKHGAEGSVKYFLFGSVSTAVMLYGVSLLFGIARTLEFSSQKFFDNAVLADPMVLFVAAIMVMGGFLFKAAAAPMHLWAPDVFQVAPTPVVAFFSTVPKIAAVGALIKFVLAINLFGQVKLNWQSIMALLALVSITFGNLSALGQVRPKRMLAYSSVAQTGFLLAGLAAFSPDGTFALLFYATVLLLMNFLIFVVLQQFENEGIDTIEGFAGAGRSGSFRSIALTIGLLSLVGIPVTAGFSAKLFVFSGIWAAYDVAHLPILLVLLVGGLINTVISVFYYLRIPYYMFLKELQGAPTEKKVPLVENLLSAFLVILIVALFFRPDLLMGWIIRINFVR